MALYLGVDTSNYTTSAALYDPESGAVFQQKRALPVGEGTVGLRQSDAVFHHVTALGGIVEELLARRDAPLAAVGASCAPTYEEGSYMPCFLVGEMAARTAAACLRVPLYRFSHQAGHIAAAAFGAGRLDLLEAPFLAFHVSGGTTQCLHVVPDDERVVATRMVARSLDLHAGQAVDRVGSMLGLAFPAGPALEKLAAGCGREYTPKPALKGADCCLSGLENQCARMLDEGESPANIAKYCLCYLRETLLRMTGIIRREYPRLPLIFAGGVMSNGLLQKAVGERFGALFAPPAFSADNAAGTAILCSLRRRKGEVR